MLLFEEANLSRSPVWRVDAPSKLLSHEVHIWRAGLHVENACYDTLTRFLSCDEIERAKHFSFESDRVRYSTARGLLRAILGRYLNVHPASISFRYDSDGRPSVTSSSENLIFDVSHANGLTLYAFGRKEKLGIDLRWRDPQIKLEEIAGKFFSPKELRFVEQGSSYGRHERFFYLWARKEAFLKTLLQRQDFLLSQLDIAGRSPVNNVEIRSFVPFGDFCAALAVHPSPSQVLFFNADRIDLTHHAKLRSKA